MNRDAADVATPAGDAAARPEHLPSVDRVLRLPAVAALIERHGRSLVTTQTREQLEQWRGELRSGSLDRAALADPTIGACIEARVAKRLAPRMKPLINLTGTVIHTNLGRSVLASEALGHLLTTMAAPNNLEYDLADGGRGDRDSLVEELLCTLTGAEAATVVNNNAAAVLLTIAALARDREVIVSRGELVEIGGAFRMPDVMASAGATLREVGTTNRTHPHDYECAIGAQTALLMKVHTSNYSVQGFTATVDEATLAALAHRHGLPLASDLGSGALVDLAAYGLPHEPMPQEMLRAGCDVVSFSGDKLLGGPQAGLIVGRREFIGRIRKTPLKRALRVSKLPLAALEATLRLYLEPEQLGHALPTLRHLTRPTAAIEAQAKALMPRVSAALAPRFRVTTEATLSQIGSGSLPVDRLPSFALRISPTVTSRKGVGSALDHLHAALRALPRPVIGRIGDDALWLDLRCLEAEDEQAMIAQLPLLQQALAN